MRGNGQTLGARQYVGWALNGYQKYFHTMIQVWLGTLQHFIIFTQLVATLKVLHPQIELIVEKFDCFHSQQRCFTADDNHLWYSSSSNVGTDCSFWTVAQQCDPGSICGQAEKLSKGPADWPTSRPEGWLVEGRRGFVRTILTVDNFVQEMFTVDNFVSCGVSAYRYLCGLRLGVEEGCKVALDRTRTKPPSENLRSGPTGRLRSLKQDRQAFVVFRISSFPHTSRPSP